MAKLEIVAKVFAYFYHSTYTDTKGVLAQRKPLLLLRFVGLFLFRFAERQLFGLLFQDPPRSTRTLHVSPYIRSY
ncbi:MAG: hypothetical protein R3E32_29060 [Chitinophagales bacterium]